MKVVGMPRRGSAPRSTQADADHVVSDDFIMNRRGPCRCAGHAHRFTQSGGEAFFSPPKRPSPKKRSTKKEGDLAPDRGPPPRRPLRWRAGAAAASQSNSGPHSMKMATSRRFCHYCGRRSSPRASPMPSPRLPPPRSTTTPGVFGFNDALPAPGKAGLLPAGSVRLQYQRRESAVTRVGLFTTRRRRGSWCWAAALNSPATFLFHSKNAFWHRHRPAAITQAHPAARTILTPAIRTSLAGSRRCTWGSRRSRHGPISARLGLQIEDNVILARKANSNPPWNFLTWNVSLRWVAL